MFILWGAPPRKKKSLIDLTRHVVIESAHPSPLQPTTDSLAAARSAAPTRR